MFEGQNIYIVDTEVLHSPDDLPTGWNNKAALGLSIGGAYSYRAQRILWFDSHTLESMLIQWVDEQPLLVGFNSLAFDFPLFRAVLRARANALRGDPQPGELTIERVHGRAEAANLHTLCDAFKALAATGYDILHEVWQVAGRSFERGLNSLDALCAANNLGQKTGTGAHAPKLWQQGEIAAVLNYCTQDILLTKALFELILTNQGTIQRRDGPLTVALPRLP